MVAAAAIESLLHLEHSTGVTNLGAPIQHCRIIQINLSPWSNLTL